MKAFSEYMNESFDDKINERIMEKMLLQMNPKKKEQFLSDCSFYMDRVWKPYKKFIYRGLKETVKDGTKKKVRKDRKPKATPMFLFDYINEILRKKFGIDRSNTLFVSLDTKMAWDFGAAYKIFPIGKFDWYVSSEIEDLNFWLGKKFNRGHLLFDDFVDNWNDMGDLYRERKSEMNISTEVAIEKVKEIINKGLDAFVKNISLNNKLIQYHEILIDCKEYYVFKG